MSGVLRVLGKAGTLTLDEIGAELNYGRGALEKALKLLEVDGAVEHDQAGYSRTANPWHPDAARFEQVTRRRRAELEEIKRYVEHTGCLMEFLARALDDPTAAPCGKCMNCAGQTAAPLAPAGRWSRRRWISCGMTPWCWQPRRLLAQAGAGEIYKVLPDALGALRERPAQDDHPRAPARADRTRALHVTAMPAGAGRSRAASTRPAASATRW